MYQYKPEDVDCKYCAEWRHRRCQAAGCPWLAERIEAGKVSYADCYPQAVQRTLKTQDIVRRFGQLVQSFSGSLWLSAEHEFNTRQLLQSVGYRSVERPTLFFCPLSVRLQPHAAQTGMERLPAATVHTRVHMSRGSSTTAASATT